MKKAILLIKMIMIMILNLSKNKIQKVSNSTKRTLIDATMDLTTETMKESLEKERESQLINLRF